MVGRTEFLARVRLGDLPVYGGFLPRNAVGMASEAKFVFVSHGGDGGPGPADALYAQNGAGGIRRGRGGSFHRVRIVAIRAGNMTGIVERILSGIVQLRRLHYGMNARLIELRRHVPGRNHSIVTGETGLLFFGRKKQSLIGTGGVGRMTVVTCIRADGF